MAIHRWWLLVAAVLSAGSAVGTIQASSPKIEPITAPEIAIQAIPQPPDRREMLDVFERSTAAQTFPLTLVVMSASDREIRELQLILPSDSQFAIVQPAPQLPDSLPPFGSFVGRMVLQPRRELAYGGHDVVLVLQYRWGVEGRVFSSAQAATVAIDVKRPFEDEAQGLPGGTAALFYFLLPVFPAFFAYQLIDRLRRREGFQVPVFGSEYILPAFFIGLLVHSLFGLDVSRATVLVAAAMLGAAWPAVRWGREVWQRRRWAFVEDDSAQEYLRKSLLSPRAPRRYLWVNGMVGNEVWTGVLLTQPDGQPVLGRRLQISPSTTADAARVQELVGEINRGGSRGKKRQLLNEARQGRLNLQALENVKRDGAAHPAIVATDELVGFELLNARQTELIVFTS